MNIYTHSVYWIHLPEHTDWMSQGYVGVSNDPKRRFNEHLNSSKSSNNKNPFFSRILQKYANVIVQTIIFQGTEEKCYMLEEELRPNKNIAWNANKGGSKPPSKTGWKPSEETLQKRSKSLTGIVRSATWCRNLSEAKQGTKNGMYGKRNPCPDYKKILIIQTKNQNKIDKLILLFKLLNSGETIRNISKLTGFGTSTVVAIKKNPKLHLEAFPILKQFKTG